MYVWQNDRKTGGRGGGGRIEDPKIFIPFGSDLDRTGFENTQPKDIHVGLIGDSKLATGVNISVCLFVLTV